MTPSDIVQKLKNQSSLFNQRGQALVEYVLLLIVTVSILLALIYQIFKPMQAFVKSYMGDYVQCLLETGELPSLGNEASAALLADEGCDSKFDAATLAGGRPPKSNSSAGSTQSSSNQGASSESDSGEGGGGGTSSASTSSRSSGNNLLIDSMRKKTGTETPVDASGKVTEVPLAEGTKFYNRKDSYSQDYVTQNSKRTYVGIAGPTEEEKKKQMRKEGNRRVVASGDDFGSPPKKTVVKPPPSKPIVEAEDTPLTFGNFFRFLLIAAIIIALIVVLGSQALKIAKSQEK